MAARAASLKTGWRGESRRAVRCDEKRWPRAPVSTQHLGELAHERSKKRHALAAAARNRRGSDKGGEGRGGGGGGEGGGGEGGGGRGEGGGGEGERGGGGGASRGRGREGEGEGGTTMGWTYSAS